MEKIIEFVKVLPLYNGYGEGNGDGNGDGDGNGCGNGCGYGNGYGDGYGDGNGDGEGNGNGYENGNGYGNGYGNGDRDGKNLRSLNNQNIFAIDSIQTIITSVKNNIAKGFIVQNDLSLIPCFIAKGENSFAHGNSIQDAVLFLRKKLLKKLPISQRIIKFKEKFVDIATKYPAFDFYEWHHFLTGSCNIGRTSFAKDHNINIDTDSFTVTEFIDLVKDSYGQNIIKELKESYK